MQLKSVKRRPLRREAAGETPSERPSLGTWRIARAVMGRLAKPLPGESQQRFDSSILRGVPGVKGDSCSVIGCQTLAAVRASR